MPDDRATQFTTEALTRVDAFIAQHPGLTRQGVDQPGQGATNRVIFARRGDSPVAFKVFCAIERKERECFGLRHRHETGLVPELIWDADPSVIVTSYVPGAHLHTAPELDGEATWREACRETGKAVGSLTCVPFGNVSQATFESSFYGELGTLEAYLGRILDLGRSIRAQDPDFGGSFWGDSLDFVCAQLDHILCYPRLLYHQDVGNLHVRRGCFMGFYDLEMCRVGWASMQLGAALGLFVGGGEAGWQAFYEGWERATRVALGYDDLKAACQGSTA
jgi:hypothetical protein